MSGLYVHSVKFLLLIKKLMNIILIHISTLGVFGRERMSEELFLCALCDDIKDLTRRQLIGHIQTKHFVFFMKLIIDSCSIKLPYTKDKFTNLVQGKVETK